MRYKTLLEKCNEWSLCITILKLMVWYALAKSTKPAKVTSPLFVAV